MPRTSLIVRWVCLLCVLLSTSALIGQETYRPLASGLEYRHDVRTDGPLSIHALRIDRSKSQWELHIALGQGTVFGLEPLDGIVSRTASALQKSPVAAINGDFFVIKPGPYQGDPRGIQITDGELVSRPTGNAFWIGIDGSLNIGPIESRLRVVWADGTESAIGLNEARADDAVALYTPTLGIRADEPPPGTRTQGGKELLLERVEGQPWLPIAVGVTYTGKVAEIRDGGDTPLSPDRMILSIGPKNTLPPIKPGNTVQLVMQTDPNLRGVKTAIGAGRILIQDGKMPDVGPADQPRHPRSMIGWNQQHLFFIVIDGRQPGVSIGMTYPEMAALAKEYRCTNAIELDGGGSSTLWAMGRTWNTPSDGKLRAIANGLILFNTEVPTFDITTNKSADQGKVEVKGDSATFDFFSPSGIGGGTITLKQGSWPLSVVLRLHLHGLESFNVSNGKVSLRVSVVSHAEKPTRLILVEDSREQDLEPGGVIRALDADGKPISGLPGQGGWFEIRLPQALLEGQPKSLKLGWIDFYRR